MLWKTPKTHIWRKVLARRDIGNVWDRRSNGTYDFVYLVIIVLKGVVDERLMNQRGVWNGSSEVRCEDWVRNGKVIRMSGFRGVLLCVWTWWGAWVQGNVYCGGWMVCCRKKEEEWRLVLGEQNQFVVGSIYAGRDCSWADLMFPVPWILKFEVVCVKKTRTKYFG